jgi:hypothetical protein
MYFFTAQSRGYSNANLEIFKFNVLDLLIISEPIANFGFIEFIAATTTTNESVVGVLLFL